MLKNGDYIQECELLKKKLGETTQCILTNNEQKETNHTIFLTSDTNTCSE